VLVTPQIQVAVAHQSLAHHLSQPLRPVVVAGVERMPLLKRQMVVLAVVDGAV
jgi:hypothetical protein